MIAVIGAGISGLNAAKILLMAGKHVKIFERSNRIGGRLETSIKTHNNVEYCLDEGATYIHGIDGHPAISYSKSTWSVRSDGIFPSITDFDDFCIAKCGSLVGNESIGQAFELFERMKNEIRSKELNENLSWQDTLTSWKNTNKFLFDSDSRDVFDWLGSFVDDHFGCSGDEIGAGDIIGADPEEDLLLSGCLPGRQVRCEEGLAACIIGGVMHELQSYLDTGMLEIIKEFSVQEIKWDEEKTCGAVSVISEDGTCIQNFDGVIVTVPARSIEKINFLPPLNENVFNFYNSVNMRGFVKTYALVEDSNLRRNGKTRIYGVIGKGEQQMVQNRIIEFLASHVEDNSKVNSENNSSLDETKPYFVENTFEDLLEELGDEISHVIIEDESHAAKHLTPDQAVLSISLVGDVTDLLDAICWSRGEEVAKLIAEGVNKFYIEYCLLRSGSNNGHVIKNWSCTLWSSVPWVQGAYSDIDGDDIARYGDYVIGRGHWQRRLWFSGDCVHDTYMGSVHGSMLSAEVACEGILKAVGDE